jgi:hypothetical protein
VMSHESERDFGVIILSFSIAALLDMQLDNNRVMLSKFHSDSLFVTNPCFIDHPWVGLGPIISEKPSDHYIGLICDE